MKLTVSFSREVVRVLQFWGSKRKPTEIREIVVLGSSDSEVNGQYFPTSPEEIPQGFIKVIITSGK